MRSDPGRFEYRREPAQRVDIRLTHGEPQKRRDARQHFRIARQLCRRNGFGILAPAHQAGHFVGFEQAIHAEPQTELIAVFARAEVSSGADREAAEGFPA
jgi:hypothetical protein